MLHTTFESTRLSDQQGSKVKLYTIEDEENLFTNNYSEHFFYENKVNFTTITELDNLIKQFWKALVSDNNGMSFNSFLNIFKYSDLCSYSNEHIAKLWKYTSTMHKETISYQEFLLFAVDLIHCRKAFYISEHKSKNNQYLNNKIKKAVEIMNQHFKEMDLEDNSEISFKNLKDCLSKENELFSRKEIELILKQINPNVNKNFEYWKFENILRILYYDNFDYNQLMKEDKIYKYLITIFSAQDELKIGKIHYMKMRYAFLIEEKLKMNKTQVNL